MVRAVTLNIAPPRASPEVASAVLFMKEPVILPISPLLYIAPPLVEPAPEA